MRVTLRGTRGSLSSPGPDTVRYGGNTSCVEVIGDEGTALVLDAGTGIRQLSGLLPRNLKRVDIHAKSACASEALYVAAVVSRASDRSCLQTDLP